MDAAHIICGIIGALLVFGSFGMLYACCVISGRCSDLEMRPTELPDIPGPSLDPLGAFGEQVEPDAIGHRA